MIFSAAYIRNLKARSERYERFEGNGLGVRVSPAGTKSWIFVYHFEGRARRYTLGRFPSLSLADARQKHGEALQALQRGTDPGARAVDKRRAERAAETVAELAEHYIENWAKRRKRSWLEDQRLLKRHVLPRWGMRKAGSIERKDIRALLAQLTSSGQMGVGANRVLAVIRKMFNYGIEEELIVVSPCAGIRPPSPESSRDRVLNREELAAFLDALPRARMAPLTRLVFRFQLLTASRISEAAGARWEEISLNQRDWLLPAERSKSKRAHSIPLSAGAIDVLAEARKLAPDSEFVFPAYRQDGPKSGATMARALLDNRGLWESVGIAPFTPHDLRRTAASHMAMAGTPRFTLSRILGHVDRSVSGIYDRYDYASEKRTALDAWDKSIRTLPTSWNDKPAMMRAV